ncbi:MAG: class I SAM-dependent methyltransferase [Nitrospirota bacterium]|nr:class I SAM-dependent methyltransferase [Nitrospirota bacterium]
MKWDAQQYDAVKAPQIDAGRELISLAQVREDDHILDLGCGTGKLTIELARLATKGRVTGLDPSEEMLKKARIISSDDGNVSLVRAAAEDIGYAEQFELVFSNSAMHWVQDQPKAAMASYQALKKGGRIAFQFPAKNFCREFSASVETAISELGYERFFEGWRSPWHFPDQEEYAAI